MNDVGLRQKAPNPTYDIHNSFKFFDGKDSALRYLIFYCITPALLAGCINYHGMRNHVVPLNFQTLSTHHQYTIPPNQHTSGNAWWLKFHDAQLNQLICVALHASPTMQSAGSRLQKAIYLTKETASSEWPYLDISGYRQRQRFSQYGLVPPPFNGETFNITDLGLNFNYEFDFWGKNYHMVAASVNEQFAANADAAEANLVISSTVASLYFQLQNVTAQLNIANQIRDQQNEILKIMQQKNQRGILSDINLTTAISNKETAISNVIKIRETRKRLLNQLAVLMGKNPANTDITINTLHYLPIELPQFIPANLLGQRPDIRASCLRVKAAANQIRSAKARFYPNINLNAFFSYQSIIFGKFFNPASQNNAISAAFDLPIFDAGARRANLGIRYAEYDLAVSSYNQAILVALREVTDQLAILKSLQSQLVSHNIALHATQRKYKLTQLNYKNGIVDYTELLKVKNNYLNDQSKHIELQTQHLQAMVAMMKALGGHDHG